MTQAEANRRRGWICPKCDKGISPDRDTCPSCASGGLNVSEDGNRYARVHDMLIGGRVGGGGYVAT